jgi:arylsulfatase A-like enzyme
MNIVIVAIDTLRPDHLGCYGYPLDTSPAIDALAAESVVFRRAFAAGIPTMPSFTTLYTGLHPYRHGIVSHSGTRRLSERIQMIPQLAKKRGYLTVGCDNLAVQGEGRGSWFARGYDQYSGYLYKPFSDQSAQLTDRALGFLDEHAEQRERDGNAPPLFLFMHYWDPHSPYGPQPPYDTMHWTPGSGPVDMADVRSVHPEYYDAFIGSFNLAHPEDFAYIVAQYDGEITKVDQEVRRLVGGLKERGYWDDTLILLLSDHGECFGEGNFFFDHHGLYDATTRIAMMMRVPGIAAGSINALVSHEDVLPTVIDIAGVAPPPYELTGVSMAPLLRGTATATRDRVVSVESSRQASLSLRTERWKLIHPIVEDSKGRPFPDFYGRPRSPEPLLFDLAADPSERKDVSGDYPDQLASMSAELEEWRAEMLRITGEPDPIQEQGLSLDYKRFMQRILGYSNR